MQKKNHRICLAYTQGTQFSSLFCQRQAGGPRNKGMSFYSKYDDMCYIRDTEDTSYFCHSLAFG